MKLIGFMFWQSIQVLKIYDKLKVIKKLIVKHLSVKVLRDIKIKFLPYFLLFYVISNFPMVKGHDSSIKMLSINIGKKLDTVCPRAEIVRVWEVEKPDILFIQEAKHCIQDEYKFSRYGKFLIPVGKENVVREDINL